MSAAQLNRGTICLEEARILVHTHLDGDQHVLRLQAPQLDRETHTKDIDFSAAGIKRRWDAGYAHTKAALERAPWDGEFDPLSGVILHEGPEPLPHAAE